MSLMKSGATPSELKAQASDLAAGQRYLAEFLVFLSNVQRRLNQKAWASYHLGAAADYVKEHRVWSLAGAAGVLIVLGLVSLIPGGKVEKAPPGPDPTAVSTPAEPKDTPAAASPTPVPRPAPNPIVRADNSGKGPYKTLKDAFADCKPDEDVVIELRTDGVVDATALEPRCKTLVLRAGAGRRPVLRRPERTPEPAWDVMFVLRHLQSVTVEGLHFVTRPDDRHAPFVVAGPRFAARGCTFQHEAGMPGSAIRALELTREVVIRDCWISSAGSPVLWAAVSGRLEMVNNALHLKGGPVVECSAPGQITTVLRRNTLVGGWSLHFATHQELKGPPRRRMTIELEGNVFLPYAGGTLPCFVSVYGPRDPKVSLASRWQAVVHWQGQNNLLGPCGELVHGREEVRAEGQIVDKTAVKELAEFRRSWAPRLELTSVQATAPFRQGQVPWGRWRLAHMRQVNDAVDAASRGVGADLSKIPEPPEIDEQGNVVRPGKAPVPPRPAEAPETPEAPSETAAPPEPVEAPVPAAPPARRLVVDPGAGPYKTLRQAFADVKPDDDVVIELCTNGLVHTVKLSVTCRNLCLKAAEGFRPILCEPWVRRRGATSGRLLTLRAQQSVSVEGLHFVLWPGRAAVSLAAAAPRVQVQGCTFRRGPSSGHGYAVAVEQPTRACVVRQCFFHGMHSEVALSMGSGTVELSNSVHVLVFNALLVALGERPGDSPRQYTLRLARNTMVTAPGAVFRFGTGGAAIAGNVTVDFDGNVVIPFSDVAVSRTGLVSLGDSHPDRSTVLERWKRVVRWRGANNIIGACGTAVQARAMLRKGRKLVPVSGPSIAGVQEFVRTWAQDLQVTHNPSLKAPYRVEQIRWHAWRLKHVRRVHGVLGANLRNVGADLSRIPDPPPIPPMARAGAR